MRTTLSIAIALLSVSLAACGGGGGGGSVNDYTGTWDVSALRVRDDCSLRTDVAFTNSILVNQDGDRIVVDSGSRVLEGETNDEDGFTVVDSVPSANGCQTSVGYSFRDASDGEADVVLLVLARCGGQECSVGYAGTGKRRERRMLELSDSETASWEPLETATTESVLSGNGQVAEGSVPETATKLLEELRQEN